MLVIIFMRIMIILRSREIIHMQGGKDKDKEEWSISNRWIWWLYLIKLICKGSSSRWWWYHNSNSSRWWSYHNSNSRWYHNSKWICNLSRWYHSRLMFSLSRWICNLSNNRCFRTNRWLVITSTLTQIIVNSNNNPITNNLWTTTNNLRSTPINSKI